MASSVLVFAAVSLPFEFHIATSKKEALTF